MKTIDTDTVPVEWLDPFVAQLLSSSDPGVHAFEVELESWEIEIGDRAAIVLVAQHVWTAELLSMVMFAQLTVQR